jgi:Holliday junction resolvase RusA-like endonuclease
MLDLPMPISVNRLWAGNGQGSLRTTAAYKAWINEAGWALIEQHPGCVHGRYRLHIEISRTGTKADLGNFEKGVSDLLQAHGVIENDRLAEEIHIAWSDELTNQCRVTIFSLPLREQGGG